MHLELFLVKDAVTSHALEVQNTRKDHCRVIFDLVCKCLLREWRILRGRLEICCFSVLQVAPEIGSHLSGSK